MAKANFFYYYVFMDCKNLSKQEIRTKAKGIRNNLDIQEISKNLVSKIKNLDIYKQSKNVLIFYPLKNEINLLDLLKDDKNFYLPKVSGENLVICPFTKDLEISKLNIFEPCSEPIDEKILDLIFLPALAADRENYRLGYGKGFYDRFLAKNPNTATILPIAKQLVFEHLPHETFDRKADIVISV